MSGIDLSSAMRIIKGAGKATPKTPVVSGIAVIKGSDEQFAAVTKSVADAGYKTDNIKDMGDGVVLFAQCDDATTGASVVRVSEASVVMLKSFEDVSKKLAADADFDPGMKASDFHVGVAVATAAYNKAVGELTAKGETDKVAPLTTKFNGYVATLLASVPGAVFKMDSEIAALVAKEDEKKEPEMTDEETAAKKKADDEAEAATKADAEAKAVAKAAEEAAKSEGVKTLEAIAALVAKVDGLATQVKTLQDAQTAAADTAAAAVTKTDKLETVLKGLVPANTAPADKTPATPKKAAEVPNRIVDTAFQSKTQKYDSLMTQ